MQSENRPVPELISKTVDGAGPPFTTASGDSMLQEIQSAYGVSQDQKLQEAKKQPVRSPVAKKPSPPTPAPKPHAHQKKLQKANAVDPLQIPRRKTKHKGEWRQRSREK